ncbi:MAG: flagellar biosynthesis protein FlhB [Rhodospirillales bacterium]
MAEEQDDASKTEEPTPKKLDQAKGKGQIAQSQEIKHWVILLGAAGGVMFMGPWMAERVLSDSRKFIHAPDLISMDFNHFHLVMAETAFDLLVIVTPIFGLLVILALGGGLAQSGLIWAPDKIKPKPSNISPLKGVKRIISIRGLVEFAKGIFKIAVVALVAFWLAMTMMWDIELVAFFDMRAVLDRLFELVVVLILATFGVMTAIAALDYMYQKYAFIKQMRMTKQEVKDEMKNAEGDPQVKARIRRLRLQRAQQRMMAEVPNADVVITNPTHYAVALTYKMEDMQAPKIVAKGMDDLALRIREIAEENDIPVVENPPLARALHAACELDDEIPIEHYQAVAEVIGYIMRLKDPYGRNAQL